MILQRDMQAISELITDNLRDSGVRAVYLTGSFARNEGCVFEGEPLSDYDILVIGTQILSEGSLAELSCKCNETLGWRWIHFLLHHPPEQRLAGTIEISFSENWVSEC